MGSTGWHLFGIAHVKVDFILHQKMHAYLKLEVFLWKFSFLKFYVMGATEIDLGA